ncbi:cold-regulated 413 inner membrane protein 2, chloroplastic-like [Lycium ferocissimum]|uniref:cold-regulated 413 inner membrane protein 2, chloroplastic-like n=1 Tax=Lycium ferocissimum TaxID=112874 RepID=UPI002815D17B|nr:cold-regulated 413 inner membrane protein 2, chloroplastic-like [Lycium ferocissimum]
MLAKGTAIHMSFLVPLFALQAPMALVSWIQCEYGIWSAFLALIIRLFFSFPGELELSFIASLMVIVAPYQVANLSCDNLLLS